MNYSKSLIIIYLVCIIGSLCGCTSIPYRISNVYATTWKSSILPKEISLQDVALHKDVTGVTERHFGPIILLYRDRTKIVVNPTKEPGERVFPIDYELTLPPEPKKVADNGNCEVVLKYDDNQIVWVYDEKIPQSDSSTLPLPNSWVGLKDGFFELDKDRLAEILEKCTLFVYDKSNDITNGRNEISFKDCMKRFTNSKIFHNSTYRYVIYDGRDTLAYDKIFWSCGLHYGDPPEKLKKDVTFIPREEKLPQHLGSFDPFLVTKNCDPLLRMPKILKGRKNFIYIKDGLFVLAYNILPRNFAIFKAMIENTFVVRK